MIKRLVAKGADLNNRNNPFNATPLSWAEHGKAMEVFDWMRTQYPVDIHVAVCFGLLDQVRARIAEDLDCANRMIDQWDIPRSTPLRHAADNRRDEIANLRWTTARSRALLIPRLGFFRFKASCSAS